MEMEMLEMAEMLQGLQLRKPWKKNCLSHVPVIHSLIASLAIICSQDVQTGETVKQ